MPALNFSFERVLAAPPAVVYHCLRDYTKAIEQYNKVIRLTSEKRDEALHTRARSAMAEIMEMLS